MSLREVVLSEVNKLETARLARQSGAITDVEFGEQVLVIAATLKGAALATPTIESMVPTTLSMTRNPHPIRPHPLSAYEQADSEDQVTEWPPDLHAQRARILQEKQEAKKKADAAEAAGVRPCMITEGMFEGMYVPISEKMPAGAHVAFNGHYFRLSDDRTGLIPWTPPADPQVAAKQVRV